MKVSNLFRKDIVSSYLLLLCLLVCFLPTANAVADNYIQATYTEQTVTINGMISIGANNMLTVFVYAPGKYDIRNSVTPATFKDFVVYHDEIIISEDGSFQQSFLLNSSQPAGVYTVSVCDSSTKEIRTCTFEYISVTEREETLNSINNCKNTEEMKVLLNGTGTDAGRYKHTLKSEGAFIDEYLSFTSINDQEDICTALVAKKPYTQDAFVKYFNEQVALKAINIGNTEQIEQLIQKYNVYININLSDSFYLSVAQIQSAIIKLYENIANQNFSDITNIKTFFDTQVVIVTTNYATSYKQIESLFTNKNDILNLDLDGTYKNLSDESKVIVQKALLGKGFKTIDEIRMAFANVVSYESSKKPISTNGNAPSGSGGTSVKFDNNVPVVPNATMQQKKMFSDLESVLWAKDSIELLAEKGIINGVGQGEFKPNDIITREQFIKILITSINLLDTSSKSNFIDINENDWFYPYVATAQKLGISTGIDEQRFGVGTPITRQEIAVLCVRASSIAHIGLPKLYVYSDFSDGQDIDSYAIEAIKIMRESGIINGLEDNKFAPKEFCTRAQAAKIIFGLLQIIN